MNYNEIISHFASPIAKIDFITIDIPKTLSPRNDEDIRLFCDSITGRVEIPKKPGGRRWNGEDNFWITIHDPSVSDLQSLIDNYYDCQIRAIEVAIDFKLLADYRSGDKSEKLLVALHGFFERNRFPSKKVGFKEADRYYFDEAGKTVRRDSLSGLNDCHTTVYWKHWQGNYSARLYIKTKDNGAPIKEAPYVRLECTLHRGGCQLEEVHCVGMLPHFVDGLRTRLSGFFCVAEGIKPKNKRCRATSPKAIDAAKRKNAQETRKVEKAFGCYTAEWATEQAENRRKTKPEDRHKIKPDTRVNNLMGCGLKRLREALKGLKLPRKVAEDGVWLKNEIDKYHW